MKLFFQILLLLSFFSGTGCKKNSFKNVSKTSGPVLSSLFNNRMLLLLKGTYATDDPLKFEETNGGTGQLYQDVTTDDPVYDLTDMPSAKNLLIHIDFGEVRISSRAGSPDLIQSPAESVKFWDFIAPYRQVYCTAPGYVLFANSCQTDSGYFRIQEFFDGNGAKYPSVDPSAETRGGGFYGSQYYNAGIYIRNFVTSFARENNGMKTDTRFDNYPVVGSNIVPRNSYIPNTSDAQKQSITPMMFPVFYTVLDTDPGMANVSWTNGDLNINPGYEPYILEMRMNIKENLMIHSWTTLAGITQTMVGFSDWKYNHQGQSDMGGNLLLRARVIYPERASSLTITGGTQTYNHYYALYGASEIIKDRLPYAAVPVRTGGSKIKYVSPGTWRLLCLADQSPVDGYPETLVREIQFTIPPDAIRQQLTKALACP
ncbi:MAG TPA: hypothetical protein PKN56_19230 [Leptospiraceae bacterium]|nr:hypothetical protein [Leptospiraceae bacterium]HNN05701.1 hypothetical protein [Leptospiraceae bacterium]